MTIKRAFRDETRGTTAIEYALIAGLISILIAVGVTAIGTNLSGHYFTPLSTNLS